MGWNEIVAALAEIIRGEIVAAGSIPFERFMELALYHPELGYYRRPGVRTGRAGDFFTSVSVGPLFGRLLARQFLEMWEVTDRPAPFWIVEQGAGDGRLAGDVLAWCRQQAPDFFKAVRYGFVGESAAAREAQARNLAAAGLDGKAGWMDGLEARERREWTGVFFSNELVDAFPVRRVVFRGGKWREGRVELDTRGEFRWGEREIADPALAEAVRELPALEGYATEINLRARRWIAEVARAWGRGYVVTIDYGFPASVYYAPFRREGTLTAYREHRRTAEVLAEPGGRDITAHVDFTALARAGEAAGLETLGFIDQQRFFTGIAHDELAGRAGPQAGVAENLRAWQTLTHPDYLGTRFQVLVQGKGVPGGWAGLRYARAGGLD